MTALWALGEYWCGGHASGIFFYHSPPMPALSLHGVQCLEREEANHGVAFVAFLLGEGVVHGKRDE